jgi:predicted urease superfamily metal-dependent hydrolase
VSRPSLARLKRAIAAVGMSPAELTALFKKHKVADLAELGQDVASRLIDALEADAAVIAARVAEEGSAS